MPAEWSEFDRLLLGMLRVGLVVSSATALFALVLAFAEPWPGPPGGHELAGLLVLAGNLAAYRYRERLYALSARHGSWAVGISAVAGAVLLVDGSHAPPYWPALLIGVGLAAAVGRVGWALLAGVVLSGCYLIALGLHGYTGLDASVAMNLTAPFILTAAVGGVQWWFARFVNVPLCAGELAPLADARLILARDARPALPTGSRWPRRLSLLPGAPSYAISTLSARERVARLSETQREIYRLQARGLRNRQIATCLHLSASTLYRERRHALRLASARTDEQLVGMLVHVDHKDQPLRLPEPADG